MKQKLVLITAALFTANQNRELKLSDPITVRISDFTLLEIHGLQVSTGRELAIMTIDDIGGHPESFWHKVEEKDVKIIEAIHARIMKLFKTAEVAA
jgi:hypothetical protein